MWVRIFAVPGRGADALPEDWTRFERDIQPLVASERFSKSR